MPMFKSAKNGHNGCYNIWYYLNKKDRAVITAVFNIDDEYKDCWYEQMDKTRKAFGNDQPWKGRKAVTYRHCVISPDPKDKATPEQCLELASKWLEKNFPDYQASVTIHVDTGIPHAHIVINNTNMNTGRRLHLTEEDNEVTLPNSVNQIAISMGLSPLPELEFKQAPETRQAVHYKFGESKHNAKGRLGWKEQIRLQIIEITKEANRPLTFDEFKAKMQDRGYDVNINSRGGYTYTHCDEIPGSENHEHWKCKGEKLGFAYTPGGMARFYNVGAERPEAQLFFQEEQAAQEKRTAAQRRLRTELLSDLTMQDRLDTLDVMKRYGIGSELAFEQRLYIVNGQLRELEERRSQLTAGLQEDSPLIKALNDIEANSKVYERLEEYAANRGVESLTYRSYRHAHQDEIQAFEAAQVLVRGNGLNTQSDIAKFRQKHAERTGELNEINRRLKSTLFNKEELQEARRVYCRISDADKQAAEMVSKSRTIHKKQGSMYTGRAYVARVHVRAQGRLRSNYRYPLSYRQRYAKLRAEYEAVHSMEASRVAAAKQSAASDAAKREADRAAQIREQQQRQERQQAERETQNRNNSNQL